MEKTIYDVERRGKQSMRVLSCGPGLGRPKQEDFKFEASLGYILSSKLAWATKRNSGGRKKR